MNTKLILQSGSAVSILFLGSVCLADPPAAPATVPADQAVEELDVEAGRIEVPNGGVSLDLGQQLSGPGGREVQRIELQAGRNYILGSVDSDGSVGFVLSPGVQVQVDIDDESGENGFRRTGVDAGGATLARFQRIFRHGSPAEIEAAEGLVDEYNELTREIESIQNGDYDESQRPARNERLERMRNRRLAIRAELRRRGVDTRDHYSNNEIGIRNGDYGSEIHGTLELRLGEAGFRHRSLDDAGVRQTGLAVQAAQVSAHGAARVNGANIDLCAAISPIGFLVGRNDGHDPYELRVSGCAGFQLGEVGNLRHEVSYEGDTRQYGRARFNTSLSRIGNLRGVDLGVSHTYEIETAEGGGRDTRHLIGVSAGY